MFTLNPNFTSIADHYNRRGKLTNLRIYIISKNIPNEVTFIRLDCQTSLLLWTHIFVILKILHSDWVDIYIFV